MYNPADFLASNADSLAICKHFSEGHIIGIVSAVTTEETEATRQGKAEQAEPSEYIPNYGNCAKNEEMAAVFMQFAQGLHLGFNKASGHWHEKTDSNYAKIYPEELSCLVYGTSDKKDIITKLLTSFCLKFKQKGYIQIYDGQAFCMNDNGETSYSEAFDGSLKRLSAIYTDYYRPARLFGDKHLSANSIFIIENICNYLPIRSSFNSFIGAAAYKATNKLLDKYKEKAFDHL